MSIRLAKIQPQQMLLDSSQNRSGPIVHPLVKNSTSSVFEPVTGSLLMNTYTMKHKISLCAPGCCTQMSDYYRELYKRKNSFIIALTYITLKSPLHITEDIGYSKFDIAGHDNKQILFISL